MKKQTIRFSKKDSKRFFITLNKRVNDHFKKLNTSKTGNWETLLKNINYVFTFCNTLFLDFVY